MAHVTSEQNVCPQTHGINGVTAENCPYCKARRTSNPNHEAFGRLIRAASRVQQLGAVTGSQWVELAGALVHARSAFNRLGDETTRDDALYCEQDDTHGPMQAAVCLGCWNKLAQEVIELRKQVRPGVEPRASSDCEAIVREWRAAMRDMETHVMDTKLQAQRRVVAAERKLMVWANSSSVEPSPEPCKHGHTNQGCRECFPLKASETPQHDFRGPTVSCRCGWIGHPNALIGLTCPKCSAEFK